MQKPAPQSSRFTESLGRISGKKSKNLRKSVYDLLDDFKKAFSGPDENFVYGDNWKKDIASSYSQYFKAIQKYSSSAVVKDSKNALSSVMVENYLKQKFGVHYNPEEATKKTISDARKEIVALLKYFSSTKGYDEIRTAGRMRRHGIKKSDKNILKFRAIELGAAAVWSISEYTEN